MRWGTHSQSVATSIAVMGKVSMHPTFAWKLYHAGGVLSGSDPTNSGLGFTTLILTHLRQCAYVREKSMRLHSSGDVQYTYARD